MAASTPATGGARRWLALCLAVLAAVSMWCYVDFVLVPGQVADSAAKGIPRGNLSDLYPRWLGARELLLHRRDPYSPAVTREIQTGYYGRPLDPSLPNDPKDQQGFAYPIYVVFFLAPTVRLPFALVQFGFRWLLLVLTLISVPLWFRALDLRPSPPVQLVWIVAVLGSFSAVQAIKLQQLTLLACALLAAAMAAWARGWLVVAGMLLAVASIKPQLVAILTLWLVIWSVGNWRERRRLFWGFFVTLLVLFAGGELILPGWMHRFRISTANYFAYTGGGKSVLDIALPSPWGKAVAVLLVLLLIAILWRMRSIPARSAVFAWILAMVLTVTLVVIPTFAPYNHLLLLPALMLILHSLPELRPLSAVLRVFLMVSAVTLLWPWVAAAVLDLTLLFLSHSRVQSASTVPLFPSLVVPLAVLGTTVIGARPFLMRPPTPSLQNA